MASRDGAALGEVRGQTTSVQASVGEEGCSELEGAGCLAGGVPQAFAHYSLSLTLVGFHKGSFLPREGGKKIKIHLQVEGQAVEVRGSCPAGTVIAAHGG